MKNKIKTTLFISGLMLVCSSLWADITIEYNGKTYTPQSQSLTARSLSTTPNTDPSTTALYKGQLMQPQSYGKSGVLTGTLLVQTTNPTELNRLNASKSKQVGAEFILLMFNQEDNLLEKLQLAQSLPSTQHAELEVNIQRHQPR